MKKHTRLARIARHVTTQLDCMQEPVCRQMLHALADIGQPLSPAHLATLLQMNQEVLRKHLARVSDTEFDEQGNIVGWGVTLVPTAHHIQLHGRPLYTWCAFDTVLFPALLQTEAQVQSVCAATGRPIAFLVTRQGIQNSLRQRACCHSSCPRSDVTVFEEPFVSSRSFSTQQRRPHLGRRCTPTPCSSRWKKRLLSDKPSRKWDHSNPFYEEWRTNLML